LSWTVTEQLKFYTLFVTLTLSAKSIGKCIARRIGASVLMAEPILTGFRALFFKPQSGIASKTMSSGVRSERHPVVSDLDGIFHSAAQSYRETLSVDEASFGSVAAKQIQKNSYQ